MKLILDEKACIDWFSDLLTNDQFYILAIVCLIPLVLLSVSFVFLTLLSLSIIYLIQYRKIYSSIKHVVPLMLIAIIFVIYSTFIDTLTFGKNETWWQIRTNYYLFSYYIDYFIFVILSGSEIPSLFIFNQTPNQHLVLILATAYLLQPIIFILFLLITSVKMKLLQVEVTNIHSIAALQTIIVSILIFSLFPTPPPWYIFEFGFDYSGLNSINEHLAGAGMADATVLNVNFSLLLWKSSSIKLGSFPSLHVFTATYIAMFLKKRNVKYGLLGYFILVTNILAVIYLGHHFLADVIFGIILAYFILKISMFLNSTDEISNVDLVS